jgi:predicted Abi (CAAX) family protease
MENDNKIVKYKGYIRKSAINILAWLENNPNPDEEKIKELIELKGRIKDSIFNYCENIKDWEKHTTTLPLDEAKLLEQKKWLEETQGTEGSGN